LRSLTCDHVHNNTLSDSEIIKNPLSKADYEWNLVILRNIHHSQCIFNRQPQIIPDLRFWFDDSGVYNGVFTANHNQQGYDAMIHGGVIAAIIDASMAQCLMGHGIPGYTADLSIRYRKPAIINQLTYTKTYVSEIKLNTLYTLQCIITQANQTIVQATARFFKVKS
jgi:acyl-coenzyme A thioesterase PaaI-like protein